MELEIKNSDSFEQLNRKKAREDAMDRILSLKAESFPQSERVYLTMSDGTGVPFRQINLTGSNPSVMVYDTAGVYGDSGASLDMPASKSFAQRAILAAALAEGESKLEGYSPCGDNGAVDLTTVPGKKGDFFRKKQRILNPERVRDEEGLFEKIYSDDNYFEATCPFCGTTAPGTAPQRGQTTR